ncbi:MAG: cell division protein ZapA [Desulfobulbaceae bacterium]|nr:cell division protein ZapA [Desulfobulbaceae bacterium]
MARLVKFEVFGQEFPLYTDAPEDEVREILDLVKTQFEEYEQSSSVGVLPANKVAVLSSLNLAGKYVKLRKDFEAYKKSLDELLDRVDHKIDSTL